MGGLEARPAGGGTGGKLSLRVGGGDKEEGERDGLDGRLVISFL
jgi:hypothetical protein